MHQTIFFNLYYSIVVLLNQYPVFNLSKKELVSWIIHKQYPKKGFKFVYVFGWFYLTSFALISRLGKYVELKPSDLKIVGKKDL